MGNTTIFNKNIFCQLGGYEGIKGLFALGDGFISEMIVLAAGGCYLPEITGIWRRTGQGWSDSVAHDIDKSLEIMMHAKALMRDRYRDLVPDNYPDLWEKDFRLSLGKKIVKSKYRHQKLTDPEPGAGTSVFPHITQILPKYFSLFIRYGSIRVIRRYLSFLLFLFRYKLSHQASKYFRRLN